MNIIHQKIIINMCISLLISIGMSLIMVNFRLFNGYKRYKVLIKVKNEDSAITVSTQIGLSDSTELNSFFFKYKTILKNMYFISISLTF